MPAGKTLDTKAYLVFREQPWKRFVLFLSFTHQHSELCVHLYDHSGGIVTPAIQIHDQPDNFKYVMAYIVFGSRHCMGFDLTISINTKTTKLNEYKLLKVLFSHQGLVGRGTVCYLVRRDGQEYIIKDHWVRGDKDVILNEVNILEALKGVPGIPELVEYWLVEMAPGEVDDTQMYRQKIYSSTAGIYRTHVRLVLKPKARPLHEFRSRKELVKAIRDIVLSEFLL
ncbi:hypothetical protein EV424DRAFT_1328124 [Suillus variegatus]|nr:hypothetical protein EV424DRAFT_1328124 [Suillus variegatus]